MRMDAYYYEFEPTGIEAIDRILSAVAAAGRTWHHTREWEDVIEEDNGFGPNKSPVEWIQESANKAADEIKAKGGG